MTDPAMIRQTASTLFQPDTVAELRILNTLRDGTVSGYFDNGEAFTQAASGWSGKAPAVYATLNPCTPALLARSANHLKPRAKTTTADQDIVHRVWFPLDFDPVRPADISSTDAEHKAALQRAEACTTWLTHRGWPLPIAADSGNGGHRLYRIDLPNDDASRTRLQHCLEALALYFSDDVVALDVKVFNAARIWKVYGTLACKGDNLPERPHRLSRLLDVPDPLGCVSLQQLADLAALLPAPPASAASGPRRGAASRAAFDLHQWITAHGLPVVAEGVWQHSGYRWVLNPCPWNPAHTNKSAFVVQFANGAIAAGCHHNGCSGADWQALRELYEPGYQASAQTATLHGGSHGYASMNGSAASASSPPPCPTATPGQAAAAGQTPAPRPDIIIGPEIADVTDAAEDALLRLPDAPLVYQRARGLCVIAYGAEAPKWLHRPEDVPIAVDASTAYLRELVGRAALWWKLDKRTKKYEQALPPAWVVETIQGRVSWPFPPLEGIVYSPTVRPDGSLLDAPGYDAETGLYLDLSGPAFPPLPAHPTLDNARTAIGTLQAPLIDFPFAESWHFSAALAAILSLVCRFAILGNVPLFAMRANTRGSGKGLLADVVSIIGSGRAAPRWPQVTEDEEERKRLLTVALAGYPVIHIDNVTKPLGSPALDLALTAPSFSDRILGTHDSREAPLSMVWLASGNNMQFKGDTARRIVPIDLDPKMEKPEERTGFHHDPLIPWVRHERPWLTVAALTIIKAFFEAGCPSQGITPMGSFEQWSALVRQALLWAGEADPNEGRKDIEAESDPVYEHLATLLEAWAQCYPAKDGWTLAQVKGDIQTRAALPAQPPNAWNLLQEALGAFDPKYDGKTFNTHVVGYQFRKFQGRTIAGRRFVTAGIYHHAQKWGIEQV